MKPAKKRLPDGLFPARIDALAHDGRGVAHLDGKAVFVHGALPGETVEFRYSDRHRQYDEGRVETVLEPSPDRVTPVCAHFGECGGCSLQHLAADRQIAYKQDWLLENLTRIGKVAPDIILPPLLGPHSGYRRKARLGVKNVRKKGRVMVGFRQRNLPYLAELARCEVLHPRIGSLLPALVALITGLSIVDQVAQIEVAVGDDHAALNFRVLSPPTEADQAALMAFGQQHELWIYLQPQGPASTYRLWPEQGELSYRLPDFELELLFQPYHFTQVNAEINQQMVAQAIDLLDVQSDERVLDLFCGLGNFTLALARRAAQVVGVEGEAALVEWAGRNAAHNGIQNAEFHTANLAAELAGQGWLCGPYDKILLDPPRSGALEMLPHLGTLNAKRIVYVSCHPATLARDAAELVHRYGYRLSRAGVMDMFPHTAHVESIALFEQ